MASPGPGVRTVLPDVPTIAEAGVPGYEATIWLGLMAPIGTPKPIVDKLNAEIATIMRRPDIVQAWAAQGAVPTFMTPEEFRRLPAPGHREVGQGGEALRREGGLD